MRLLAMMAILLAACFTSAAQAGDATKGQAPFRTQCSSCHAIPPEADDMGPSLPGVIGRKAGTAPGFAGYSDALKASGLTWDEALIDKYLADAKKLVPGTRKIVRVTNAAQRADILAYLATLKASTPR